MKVCPFLLLPLILAVSLLLSACSDDSYDPLIEEYNENFTVVNDTDGAQYSVDDENFDASWMLRDLYTISHMYQSIKVDKKNYFFNASFTRVDKSRRFNSSSLTGVDSFS